MLSLPFSSEASSGKERLPGYWDVTSPDKPACRCPETIVEQCINGMVYGTCGGEGCDSPCEPICKCDCTSCHNEEESRESEGVLRP